MMNTDIEELLTFPNSSNMEINFKKVKFLDEEIHKEIKFKKNFNFKVQENKTSENFIQKIQQKIKKTLINSNLNEEKSLDNKFM